jgi:hypothetical protein
MGAAVVRGDDLDILMTVTSVQLVLDAEIGEVDAVVEIRQGVLTRPAFDLAGVAIGSSIAVRPASVPLLEPHLILALERVVEDDAPNVRALVAEPFLFPQVGAIELDVVRQLPGPAHAGVEGLLPRIVAVAAMGFQEVVAASSESHGVLAAVQRDEPHQSFISQVTEVGPARISRLLARVPQIAFGHHPKRSDGRKRPAVVAVEFVPVITIHHDLPFEPAGQFEALKEYIARIVIPFASVPITVTNVATVARIIWFAIKSRLMTRLHPRHLDVADVIVAVAVARIEVEHGFPRRWRTRFASHRDDEGNYAKPRNRRQSAIGRRRTL